MHDVSGAHLKGYFVNWLHIDSIFKYKCTSRLRLSGITVLNIHVENSLAKRNFVHRVSEHLEMRWNFFFDHLFPIEIAVPSVMHMECACAHDKKKVYFVVVSLFISIFFFFFFFLSFILSNSLLLFERHVIHLAERFAETRFSTSILYVWGLRWMGLNIHPLRIKMRE